MTSLVRRYPIHQYVVLGAGMAAFIATQWISDDGFIYLTYVDNLVRNGVGAVFNADEYVEGYTSVAWLGLLSIARAFSDLLGSSASLRQLTLLLSHGLSLTALVLVLEINRSAVVRAVGNDKDRLDSENINLPLVFIVGTRAVHQFASSGLETPLVLVFSVLVARQLLTPSRGIVWPSILVGAGPLIRPDLALLSVVILVHAFFLVNRKTALLVAAAAIIPNLMVVTMRVWLYASILPNTYFAKTGIDNPLRHGIYYLYDVTYAYAIQWIALFALFAILLLFRREPAGAGQPAFLARRRRDLWRVRGRCRRRLHAWSLLASSPGAPLCISQRIGLVCSLGACPKGITPGRERGSRGNGGAARGISLLSAAAPGYVGP